MKRCSCPAWGPVWSGRCQRAPPTSQSPAPLTPALAPWPAPSSLRAAHPKGPLNPQTQPGVLQHRSAALRTAPLYFVTTTAVLCSTCNWRWVPAGRGSPTGLGGQGLCLGHFPSHPCPGLVSEHMPLCVIFSNAFSSCLPLEAFHQLDYVCLHSTRAVLRRPCPQETVTR